MDNNGALLELKQVAASPLEPSSLNEESPPTLPRLADLLDQTGHTINYYCRLPNASLATLAASWIALTYLYDSFRYCGYLALRSATPRCGKTRLLRLLALLALDTPAITTTPTAPVLFRSQRKVLILDEVDRLRNADKENFGAVLSVLNVGFEKGSVVERTEKAKGGNFEVRAFPVYRPVALAGIESLADTLSDRTFQVQMERTPDRMPRFSARVLDDLTGQLRAGFQAWAECHREKVEMTYDALPDEVDTLKGFDDRFQDISEPLMVLAALADNERPEGPAVLPRLLEGLTTAAGRREPSGRERELLAFIEVDEPLLNGGTETFLSSATVLDLCKEREELSRLETGRALAGFLKHFDLYPKSHSGKARGYVISREWLITWSARYGRS